MTTALPEKIESREPGIQGHGVIWITGYSAAGKTTVGRHVERALRDAGVTTVFLDGDDLRSILAHRWGYDREERIDLARVYFRLCSHLASQGVTVVISAVAMYSEVQEWVKANVPNAMAVYLHVPEEERRRRDSVTKRIYREIGNTSSLYDEPRAPDLRIDNFGGITPGEAAERIIGQYRLLSCRKPADVGRSAHWQSFYKSATAPSQPSAFAREIAARLPRGRIRLVEIGCGNGRDASYFAGLGYSVIALDTCDAAIDYCRTNYSMLGLKFELGSLPDVAGRLDGGVQAIYSRFCFHAMNQEEEWQTLTSAAKLLKRGGQLFIECRSINDPLARLGEVISPTERIYGHYRRFIVPEDLKSRVHAAGFGVTELIESKGLAVFGDEDPVVIRVIADRL